MADFDVVAFSIGYEMAYTTVLDMLDEEEMMREFADQVGPPPGMLRSPEEMEARRKASQSWVSKRF